MRRSRKVYVDVYYIYVRKQGKKKAHYYKTYYNQMDAEDEANSIYTGEQEITIRREWYKKEGNTGADVILTYEMLGSEEEHEKSKTYVASWVLTWLTLQATRIITIIGAGILVIGESDRFNLFQFALIKFGAIIIGFLLVTVLNRAIEAIEDYCHRKDI